MAAGATTSSLELDALDAQSHAHRGKIASIADATVRRSLELMRLPSRLPVLGAELTSSFGNRTDPFARSHAFHAGLDFAAVHGTPITAAAGGAVVFAGWKNDYGWTVEINHGNGLSTRYAHASKLLVQAGRVVVPGDRIALVARPAAHAPPHFEVLRNGGLSTEASSRRSDAARIRSMARCIATASYTQVSSR